MASKALSLYKDGDYNDGQKPAAYEERGLTLLTQAPARAKPEKSDDPEWQYMRLHLELRLGMMQNWRNSWWEHWALLAQYLLPRRYHWLITPNQMNRGLPINQAILDETGVQAMNICAQGLMNNLASPAHPWFKLALPLGEQVSREGQMWLDDVETRILGIMANSNFYPALTQMFEDLTCFGTAPMIIYEDATDVIRCYNPCAGEYYVATGSDGRVEALFRKFNLTVSQIVEMFGLENCPEEITLRWEEKNASLDAEYVVAHAIEPNFAIAKRGDQGDIRMVPGPFLYREAYWLWGNATSRPMSMRGFREAPFVCPRWKTTSNDPYGRSVAMDVLPAVMQLQVMTKRQAQAIEKHVNPPLLGSIELKNQPASVLPGNITYVQQLGPQAGLRPVYEIQPDLTAWTGAMEKLQQRIQKGFFNDLFQMLDNLEGVQPRNEMEISERKAEKLQVLGPTVQNFQKEAAAPLIMRIFNIGTRRKMFAPAPQELQGKPLRIEYINQFTLAQKAASTSVMERGVQLLGNLAAVRPEVLDLVNWDEWVLEYFDRLTMPHKIMNDPKVVAAVRAQKQQAQQQQQQAEAASHAAQVIPPAAQQLSDTQVGGGQSALQLMLGSMQGGATMQ